MKYSFITFTFGDGRLKNLELVLHSVDRYRDDEFEYIVLEVNGTYAKDLADKYNFKYYSHEVESKALRSIGRNLGALRATGDYLVIHDNDVVIDEHFFDDIKSFSSKYDYYANFSELYSMSEKTTNDIFNDLANTDYGYSLPKTKPQFSSLRRFGYKLETVVAPHGGSFTITKDLYKKVGGFDPIYLGWGSEDSDFRFRVLCTMPDVKRYGMIRKPLIHTWHKVSYDSKSTSDEKNNIKNSRIFTNRVHRYKRAIGDIKLDWVSGGRLKY
jgi:predicted glycosyltransferase involved in capsule biosynthesis